MASGQLLFQTLHDVILVSTYMYRHFVNKYRIGYCVKHHAATHVRIPSVVVCFPARIVLSMIN